MEDKIIIDENGKFTYESIVDQLNGLSGRFELETAVEFFNNHSEMIAITQKFDEFLDKKNKQNLYIIFGMVIICFKSSKLREKFLEKEDVIKQDGEFMKCFQESFMDIQILKTKMIYDSLSNELVHTKDEAYTHYQFPELNFTSNQPEMINFVGTYMFTINTEKWTDNDIQIESFLFVHMFINIIAKIYFEQRIE